MDKIDSLIVAIQRELQQHNWDTFQVEASPGGPLVTVVGCTVCRKQIGTTNQLIAHLANDAIPALFTRLRAKKESDAKS
jgi:Ser/Thr protein kinase RdoA (MazF antagonist)